MFHVLFIVFTNIYNCSDISMYSRLFWSVKLALRASPGKARVCADHGGDAARRVPAHGEVPGRHGERSRLQFLF